MAHAVSVVPVPNIGVTLVAAEVLLKRRCRQLGFPMRNRGDRSAAAARTRAGAAVENVTGGLSGNWWECSKLLRHKGGAKVNLIRLDGYTRRHRLLKRDRRGGSRGEFRACDCHARQRECLLERCGTLGGRRLDKNERLWCGNGDVLFVTETQIGEQRREIIFGGESGSKTCEGEDCYRKCRCAHE
jgi:hypothetical protein